MSLAIISPNEDVSRWVTALQTHNPALNIEVWPEIENPDDVLFALCWNHPAGSLQLFPNLKCISSLGAGINHLLNDSTRPLDIPLVRLVDEGLKQSMAEYVMLGVLEHFRRFKDYHLQQLKTEWAARPIPHISAPGIGIMGCGEIGRYVANKLADFGFSVHGWSRTPQAYEKFLVYSGNGDLEMFLSQTDILVCLLPLTPETENILSLQTFSQLRANAYLINVGRGAHLVEEDLLTALESGKLSGALLDVFKEEPLPQEHPFWTHDKISITPHIASQTNPESAVEQIVENYRRVINGAPLLNLVDVKSGY